MDRRLRELQEELAPSPPPPDEPAPVYDDNGPRAAPMPRASVRPGVAPAPVGPEPVGPRADVLALMYRRLLASMRELLDGYELLLSGQGSGSVPGVGPGSVPASVDPARAEVTVSAGPFSGTPALRDFERALAELSGVRGVSLRGYDSDDRAIWDVELR